MDLDWFIRKLDGIWVENLLAPLPIGFVFRLDNVGSSYSGTYQKRDSGQWDQVSVPVLPRVLNMDADHLGFCVGYRAISDAVQNGAHTDIVYP